MQQEQTRAAFREALSLLRDGVGHLRQDLFAKGPDVDKKLQRKALDGLAAMKVLERVEVATGSVFSVEYRLRNLEELEVVLDDEEKLHNLIWPNGPPMEKQKPPPEPPKPPPAPVPTPVMQSPFPPGWPAQQPTWVRGADGNLYPVMGPPMMAPQPMSPPPVAPMLQGSEERALLEQLVQLLHAAFESLVYTREKVDKIEKRVEELSKMWETSPEDDGG